MGESDSSRRDVLKRGALLGGALVPAGLAARTATAVPVPPRGPSSSATCRRFSRSGWGA